MPHFNSINVVFPFHGMYINHGTCKQAPGYIYTSTQVPNNADIYKSRFINVKLWVWLLPSGGGEEQRTNFPHYVIEKLESGMAGIP